MKIINGSVVLERPYKEKQHGMLAPAIWAPECHLCMQKIENPEQSRIGCLNSMCKLTCHVICLANHLLTSDPMQKGHYVPIGGECPLCETALLWIEILEKKRRLQGISMQDYDHVYTDSDDEQECSDSDCEIIFSQDIGEQTRESIDFLDLSD